MTIRALACAGLALVALAGCHKDGKGGDQRTASGEVLEGSISDGMIPYESLKSKPPLAPRTVAKAGGGAAAVADAASGDAPVEAAPAAEPAPAPGAAHD